MARKNEGITIEEAEAYKRMAERFNRQMRRIKAAEDAGRRGITSYAYRIAESELLKATGTRRMPINPPTTRRELERRQNIVQRFYEKPTSTLKGIDNVYDKRSKTMSKLLEVEVDKHQLARMFESGLYEALSEKHGYLTAFKLYGKILQDRDKIRAQLKEVERIKLTPGNTLTEGELISAHVKLEGKHSLYTTQFLRTKTLDEIEEMLNAL